KGIPFHDPRHILLKAFVDKSQIQQLMNVKNHMRLLMGRRRHPVPRDDTMTWAGCCLSAAMTFLFFH
ncbi:hypothetical protein CPB84DRAFT_1759535, partial [Gymnopilus junonius]